MQVWIRVALLAALVGCNSGGSDPVSACKSYCEHVMSCEGIGGSAIDNACSQACADAGSFAALCHDSSTAVTNLYNCFGSLPCSDFSPDAGSTAPLTSCVTQSGCM